MVRSLRARFLLIFGAIALFLAGLLGVAHSRLAGLYRGSLQSRTAAASRTGAAVTHAFLSTILHDEQDMGRALVAPGWTDATRQVYLPQALLAHPEFQAIYYLSGDQVLHAGSPPRSSASVRSSDAVRDVLRGQSWSLVFFPESPGSGTLEMAVVVPAPTGGRQGILLGVLPSQSLRSELPASPWGSVSGFILDAQRRLVCVIPGSSLDYLQAVQNSTGLPEALSGREAMERNLPGGQAVTASYEPVAEFGWAAAAVQPLQSASASESGEMRIQWGWFMLLILLGLGLVVWQTGELLQSISRLQRAAQAVAGGDIGYRVKMATGTEMDMLAGSFNNMAEQLGAHQDLLHDRNQQLNVLLRVVEGLRPERDREDLLRRITQDAAFLTGAGVAFLAQVENEQLSLAEWWNGNRWIPLEHGWRRGDGVVGWVWLNHDTRAAEDYSTDPYAKPQGLESLDLRNYVCSPIVLPNGAVAGVLFVANKANNAIFTEDDIRIMELLARHAGVALEVEAAFLRERRIGATLQKAMLPDVDPHLGGLSIAREYHAASDETELGGDFYDVIVLSPNTIGLVIADVSGKGLRAAVQTAAVKYALRAYALEDPEPSSVLNRLNHSCCAGPPSRGFVTLFYAVIDLKNWKMRCANAGHQPPLVRHMDGRVDSLTVEGMVLGVTDSTILSFPQYEIDLRAGDTVVLYTDGLSEARRGDEFLDVEGLQAVLGHLDLDAQETAHALVREAMDFADGVLRDDVALLVVKIPNPLPRETELPRVVRAFEL